MRERRGVYRVLVGKPVGQRPLGRPRRRRKDNIKIHLQKVGKGAWTELIWLRIWTGGGTCECGNEPSDSITCGEYLD